MSLRPTFARAAAVMTRVGGDIASYQHKQGGPPFAVYVILRQPEERVFGIGGSPGKTSVRVEAVIAKENIGPGRPQRGDLLGIGSEMGWKVETVDQDRTESFYLLGLTRQD